MKNLINLMLFIIFFIHCTPVTDSVEKYFEDGVEVVINHLEPYEIKGEPAILTLEKEYSIDFGGDDIGEMGIARTTRFEVDLQGNIYFFRKIW